MCVCIHITVIASVEQCLKVNTQGHMGANTMQKCVSGFLALESGQCEILEQASVLLHPCFQNCGEDFCSWNLWKNNKTGGAFWSKNMQEG